MRRGPGGARRGAGGRINVISICFASIACLLFFMLFMIVGDRREFGDDFDEDARGGGAGGGAFLQKNGQKRKVRYHHVYLTKQMIGCIGNRLQSAGAVREVECPVPPSEENAVDDVLEHHKNRLQRSQRAHGDVDEELDGGSAATSSSPQRCVAVDLRNCELGPSLPPKFFETYVYPAMPPNYQSPLGSGGVGESAVAVVEVDLGGNALQELPVDFCKQFPHIGTLFLSSNKLAEVPWQLLRCANSLTRLSMKSNFITSVDPARDLPTSLVHLILTENRISSPFRSSFCDVSSVTGESFGQLRKLMLAGNALSSVHDILGEPKTEPNPDGAGEKRVEVPCAKHSLELLRLTRNKFGGNWTEADVAVLRNTEKLTWTSFAGNPEMFKSGLKATLRMLSDGDGTLGVLPPLPDLTGEVDCTGSKVLGQGTSGIVRLCKMKAKGTELPVAVKFLKKISSDGSGRDERDIIRAVPRHPLLAAPLGTCRFTLSDSHSGFSPSAPEVANLEVLAGGGGSPGAETIVFPFLEGQPLALAPDINAVATDRVTPQTTIRQLARDVDAVAPSVTPCMSSSSNATMQARLALAIRILLDVGLGVSAIHTIPWLVHGDIYMHNTYFTPTSVLISDTARATPHASRMSRLLTAARDNIIQGRAGKTNSGLVADPKWLVEPRIVFPGDELPFANPFAKTALSGHRAVTADFGASFLVGGGSNNKVTRAPMHMQRMEARALGKFTKELLAKGLDLNTDPVSGNDEAVRMLVHCAQQVMGRAAKSDAFAFAVCVQNVAVACYGK